jgi:isoleucyl-tRNA synthetase
MNNAFPKTYDFKKIEAEAESLWSKKRIVERALYNYRKKPLFSFLEGPPTANAPPGLHHAETRIFKDLVCRYNFMNGFSVPRKGGWDCHGLPVEVQVEKKLRLTSKKDVLKYGVDRFTKICKTDVFSHIREWEKFTKKLGFWIDLKRPYVTMENNYIESVWWSIKELYGKNLLYEGLKIVPYCPRCETALSSHEVALGYQDIIEDSLVVKFKLLDEERYVLAWTTTPWTLPSNLALAINPNIDYVVVSYQNEEYILAKATVQKYFKEPKIVQEIKGSELIGKSYVPLFKYYVEKYGLGKKAWKIYSGDFVATEEGTGVVHIAPYGEDDFVLLTSEEIALVQPVAEDGHFKPEVSDFAGLFVKDADPKIIEHLQKKGLLFLVEKYPHSYPFCWRCDTPLLYYVKKSWFIRVTACKEQLLANNEKVNWYPAHIKEGRFGDWLSNVKDWALSRSKFWGTPLPIWRCKCGKEVVIGSVKELREKGINVPQKIDLHKPFIDEIKLRCVCRKAMSRVPDVIDCWYDSGSATFAQFHYPFENVELFKKSFPYDFIAEAIDQTRGWFYTLHVLGTLLFDSPAYKNVVCAGHIVDENGDKMSKSKGNVIDPWEVFDKIGIDALRLQMCSASPGNPKRFGYSLVNESTMPFLTIMWNSCYFVSEFYNYQASDGSEKAEYDELHLEDKWLISRVNALVKAVSENLDKNEYQECISQIRYFINEDFSRWYIKLVRERSQEKDKALAYTFRYTLTRLSKIIAPFAPYFAEYIFQYFELGEEKSVHLSKWPRLEKPEEQLLESMEQCKGIVQGILSAREKINLGVRWPLQEVVIESEDEKLSQAVEMLKELISRHTNIREVYCVKKFEKLKTVARLDYNKIKSEFKDKSAKIIANLVTRGHNAVAEHLEKEGRYEVKLEHEKIVLTKNHISTSNEVPEHYSVHEFEKGKIYLNKQMSEELETEGYVRELARRIQSLRKQAGLQKGDKINAMLIVSEGLGKRISPFLENLKQKTGSEIILINKTAEKESYSHSIEENIKKEKVNIFLKLL